MKKIFSILFVVIFFQTNSSFAVQSDDFFGVQESVTATDKVVVYYFHGDRRCVTCKAVGSVSQELVESKYKDNPKVKFIEINIDESGNEDIVRKFRVTGSGLYVSNGVDNVNITAFAFQYAINNPDKLKNKLIQLINRDL